jgi:hypothetical protein
VGGCTSGFWGAADGADWLCDGGLDVGVREWGDEVGGAWCWGGGGAQKVVRRRKQAGVLTGWPIGVVRGESTC